MYLGRAGGIGKELHLGGMAAADQLIERCIEIAESPWARREENILRAAWNREFK